MDVDDVKSELEDLGQAKFVERYGRFYLVLTDPEALESFAGFVNTASRESNEILGGKKKLDGVDIRPLVPRKGGSNVSVTIGREDADVEISSKKISKLHAIFTVDAGLPSLTDAGSKNGTWLNGKMLSPNRPAPVDVGDTIQFGSLGCTLWGLEDLLAAVGGSV